MNGWLARVAILATILARAALAPAGEASHDERFLEGLRQRRLFGLAVAYCQRRLADSDLPPARRAELTIELSRSLADQAVGAPADQGDALWKRSFSAVDAFVAEHPNNPRLLLVKFQGALAHLARGELARQQSLFVDVNQALVATALDELRAAIRTMREIEKEADEALRWWNQPGRRPDDPALADRLSPNELLTIENNVHHQLARAYRNQGLCYPAGSADRTSALLQAVDLLEPLARLDPEDPLSWKCRIEEIVCLRHLGEGQKAWGKLEALFQSEPPPETALRARAERVRLLLAAGQLQQAVADIEAGRDIGGVTSPDLDYAHLETALAAWKVAAEANQPQQAEQWKTRATQMAEAIRTRHGPFWGYRAERLLARSARSSPGDGDLAMLLRVAEDSYQAGRLDDAVRDYGDARAEAQRQGNAEFAFKAGYLAAAIEHKRGRHREAKQRFRELALAATGNPKAPEAHMLAINNAAQIAAAEPDSADALAEYGALLVEHLDKWPRSPFADEVHWLLGRLREHQRNWQGAIAAYDKIPEGTEKHVEAVRATARCYEAWLAERKAAGDPTSDQARNAAEWLESILFKPSGRFPERWSPLHRFAAAAAARIRLEYTADGASRAEQILSAALAGAADAPEEWRSTTQALLVFALAAQGKNREAQAVLGHITQADPQVLLSALESLGRVDPQSPQQVRAERAALQLRAIAMLAPSYQNLPPASRQSLDQIYADALAATGEVTDPRRRDEILQTAAQLAEKYRARVEDDPKNAAAQRAYARVQEAYAQVLLNRPDRKSWQASQQQWRELAAKSKPGSPPWFRAKYAVALLHHRLGNNQQAVKMIQLIRVLHPDFGGMTAEFRDLAQQCGWQMD